MGIGVVVMSRCSTHLKPLASLDSKSAQKRARNLHIVWGLEMWPPQLHSTVSMATQPTAAAAKVEGTWKGLRRITTLFQFPRTRRENEAEGKEEGMKGGGREREQEPNRNEYEWRNERGREKEERMWERGRGRPMNTGIVPSVLNLIYHIITPRKKNTSIFWRNGDVSMENLGILVHNRSGVKKAKRSKTELPGVWCISELKMDDADYKVFFSFLFSLLFPLQGRCWTPHIWTRPLLQTMSRRGMKRGVDTPGTSFLWPNWVSNHFLQPISVEVSAGPSSQKDHLEKPISILSPRGTLWNQGKGSGVRLTPLLDSPN